MTDETEAQETDTGIEHDGVEAETSQAVTSLEVVAVRLRELADEIVEINKKPLEGAPPTVH